MAEFLHFFTSLSLSFPIYKGALCPPPKDVKVEEIHKIEQASLIASGQ